jgi:D-tyrosyl-tRNA(Tyr) deacylase
VTVNGEVVGSIGSGLVVLIGVTHGDGPADAQALAAKVAGLRIFPDDDGKMNRSLSEVGGEALVVSQFTLYADLRKGRRPAFTEAALPEVAEPLVALAASGLADAGIRVASGRFGAKMEVDLTNTGPVTIVLEVRGGRVL